MPSTAQIAIENSARLIHVLRSDIRVHARPWTGLSRGPSPSARSPAVCCGLSSCKLDSYMLKPAALAVRASLIMP